MVANDAGDGKTGLKIRQPAQDDGKQVGQALPGSTGGGANRVGSRRDGVGGEKGRNLSWGDDGHALRQHIAAAIGRDELHHRVGVKTHSVKGEHRIDNSAGHAGRKALQYNTGLNDLQGVERHLRHVNAVNENIPGAWGGRRDNNILCLRSDALVSIIIVAGGGRRAKFGVQFDQASRGIQ